LKIRIKIRRLVSWLVEKLKVGKLESWKVG